MARDQVMQKAAAQFEARFGTSPDVTAYAPGRVNLLGEHTDYNGGLVLPMPLALGTAVSIGRGGSTGELQIASDAFEEADIRRLQAASNGAWSDYVLGSVREVGGDLEDGLRIMVSSDLPVGSGLSSSAALEVATMRAMADLTGQTIDAVELAKRARSVENDFVGLPCGIMDQFCVSVGEPGSALYLDTRTLQHEPVPLIPGYNFVIVHSGVSHKLTDDGYATRVKECQEACVELNVEMLSDLSQCDLERIGELAAPLNGRARHIVTENARVRSALDALSVGDAARFGTLMVESHASQRDDYSVSVPEVDALVENALKAGATGARLTGGGFGGSIVAFVEAGSVAGWCKTIEQESAGARVLAVT